jgi:TetR/AcrR family transcriptional repressor of nem operon
MPWAKQFDETEALGKAMKAFWARGYEATSVQDLVDCTGLNRGSLYASFGDKRRLFLKTLEHYECHERRAWFEALRRSRPPREAILAVFEGALAAALDEGDRSGCFLVNTAIEMSSHDPEVARAVAEGLVATEACFRELVRAGQADGSIPASVDAANAARALLGLLAGLRVLARSRPERPLLQAVADQAAAILQ